MTQIEFDRMPLLMKPRDACLVFGCTRNTLADLRVTYMGLAVRLPGMKQWRYRKVIVAKIAGLRYE